MCAFAMKNMVIPEFMLVRIRKQGTDISYFLPFVKEQTYLFPAFCKGADISFSPPFVKEGLGEVCRLKADCQREKQKRLIEPHDNTAQTE